MVISELFNRLGLKEHAVSRLIMNIRNYNKQNTVKTIPEIELNSSIDLLTMSQTPFIGRALGKERNREFLDDEQLYPLSIDVNAMRYAALEMDIYFRKNQ